MEAGGLLVFAPWTAKVAPKMSGYESIQTFIKKFSSMVLKHIVQHTKTYSDEFQR